MDIVNKIKGVILTPLRIIDHPLGDVYHGMKKSDNGFNGFGEAYFSTIKHNVVKQWKKHTKMTLNLIVPMGEIRFVMYDDRENSPTRGNYMDVFLSKNNYYRLTVPPDIWLAFKGMSTETNLLLNMANLEHDSNEVIRKELSEIPFNWGK